MLSFNKIHLKNKYLTCISFAYLSLSSCYQRNHSYVRVFDQLVHIEAKLAVNYVLLLSLLEVHLSHFSNIVTCRLLFNVLLSF